MPLKEANMQESDNNYQRIDDQISDKEIDIINAIGQKVVELCDSPSQIHRILSAVRLKIMALSIDVDKLDAEIKGSHLLRLLSGSLEYSIEPKKDLMLKYEIYIKTNETQQ